ncbi:MAG: helix-turn-helix domain-containing protein [Eubacterium sp.]|nr:helix-turn-helix domain-containing protein [Eubacterium sp.]
MNKKEKNGQVVFQVMQRQETTFCFDQSLHIFYGLAGTAEVFIEDQGYELCPGGILAVGPHMLYRVCCIDASLIRLEIPPEAQRLAGGENAGGYACYVRDEEGIQPEFRHVRELYATLFYEYLQNHHSVSWAGDGSLMQLLQYIRERFGAKLDLRSAGKFSDEKTASFIQYIEEHWDEEVTLSSLAREMHFSVSYLSRYFVKATGMNFKDYLRKVRMIHARRMLVQGSASVTQIALDCGFRNPSVFIEAFKQEYQKTPGQFRQCQTDAGKLQAGILTMRDQRSDLSVLLVHMPEKKQAEITRRNERITTDCSRVKDVRRQTRILNIGYAKDGLLEPVQQQIRRAQAEIGFTWFRCHGLFDKDMYLYSEDEEGGPVFSFAYLDMLLDFVTGLGLKPFLEFGFMPPELAKEQTRIFDRPSVISGCADLEKWKLLVRAVLTHFAERYGTAALCTWRFATISLSYVRIGCLTLDDFAELYETTWHTVKEFDRELSFGGAGYFPDLTENEKIGTPWFLQFATEHGCPPDFHSMQWYPCVRTDDTLFMEYTLSQRSAPALLSTDPDYLKKKLDELDLLFEKYHLEDRELFLEECNSTLWQRDLSGDTCYKAVWLAKNMLLSAGRAAFGYWLLTDLMEERAHIQSVFHGGYGLFTYDGIPKAGYTAMRMIAALGEQVIDEGDGWILTGAGAAFVLLVYNYTHYTDLNCYRYKQLEVPGEAYSVFLPGEKVELQFHLGALSGDTYRITRRKLNRAHGSSFDRWLELQTPECPDQQTVRYLTEQAEPAVHMETVSCTGQLTLEVSCMPLEMELIRIEPV